MRPWSVATAPTWTLTRTNRAPVATATARADSASLLSTLTPKGRAVTRVISPITTDIAATVAASTRPLVNGTSPKFSTRSASTPPSARPRASSSAAWMSAFMLPAQRGVPGRAPRCTMPMTARSAPAMPVRLIRGLDETVRNPGQANIAREWSASVDEGAVERADEGFGAVARGVLGRMIARAV